MKRAYFCIADNNNLEQFKTLEKSFKHFHPNEELILIGEKEVKETNDPHIFYRATPYFAKKLMDLGFDEVCKLDADQIILGNLDHIWNVKYDIGAVNNSNPKELKSVEVSVWDIHPMAYLNCGFVVMKSKEVVDHWLKLCYSPHFNSYQFREQDLLNIIAFYGNYDVALLDSGNKWHGLISKGYWPQVEYRDGKFILPKGEEWPKDEDKEIVCIHWAGGNTVKGNYKIHFKDEVADKISEILK